MKSIYLLSLLFCSSITHAAVFDAADYLAPGNQALGVFGEALLSDPSSQGVEARYRMGISDDLNAAGIIGTGSDNRQFRLGAEAVYNLLPDVDHQFGLSGLGSALILKRQSYTAFQLRVGPMVNKTLTGFEMFPANIYVAIPFYFEFHGSTITTGSQLVLGTAWDLSDRKDWYAVTEGGVQLANSESYILLGFGIRFGASSTRTSHKRYNQTKDSTEDDREYKSEDFQKK